MKDDNGFMVNNNFCSYVLDLIQELDSDGIKTIRTYGGQSDEEYEEIESYIVKCAILNMQNSKDDTVLVFGKVLESMKLSNKTIEKHNADIVDMIISWSGYPYWKFSDERELIDECYRLGFNLDTVIVDNILVPNGDELTEMYKYRSILISAITKGKMGLLSYVLKQGYCSIDSIKDNENVRQFIANDIYHKRHMIVHNHEISRFEKEMRQLKIKSIPYSYQRAFELATEVIEVCKIVNICANEDLFICDDVIEWKEKIERVAWSTFRVTMN